MAYSGGKAKATMWVAALAVGVAVCTFLFARRGREGQDRLSASETNGQVRADAPKRAVGAGRRSKGSGETRPSAPKKIREERESEPSADPAEPEENLTEEEKREREEEKQIEIFDGLTDKWMEPAEGGVTMKDVDAFVAQFRKVPTARKEECLHRALNLVPDENVMLLAGILMDKSQDKELVELVYNDVLNRDEAVKKPILQQIFKDKDHPCWTDTAWILDVTGDLPGKK